MMFTKKADIIRRALLQELANEKERKKKSLKLCEAEKCKNSSYNCDLSFFKFPRHQPERMKKWLENIILKKSGRTKSWLCSNHFEENAFTSSFRTRLHFGAMPTIQDPNDLANEKPKPHPCLLGLPTLRDLNAVKDTTTCSEEAEKDSTVTTGKDGFALNKSSSISQLACDTTNLESMSSVSVPRIQTCSGNIKYHRSTANKATMTSSDLHVSSAEYADLKAKIRAKSSAVSKLKRRIDKIDNKVPTPSQLIKYASHYLTGKTLSLFAAQIQNATGKAKHWSKDNLEVANTIYQMNRCVYRYLISSNILHLPCRQTLKRFRSSKQEVCDHVYNKATVKPSEKLDETNGICPTREISNGTSENEIGTSENEIGSSENSYIIEPYIVRLKPCEVKKSYEVIEEPMELLTVNDDLLCFSNP